MNILMDLFLSEDEKFLFNETNKFQGQDEVILLPLNYRALIQHYLLLHKTITRCTIFRSDSSVLCDFKIYTGPYSYTILQNSFIFITEDNEFYLVDLSTECGYKIGRDHEDWRDFYVSKVFGHEQGHILVIEGCLWSSPYEYRFFDIGTSSKLSVHQPLKHEEFKVDVSHNYRDIIRWNSPNEVMIEYYGEYYPNDLPDIFEKYRGQCRHEIVARSSDEEIQDLAKLLHVSYDLHLHRSLILNYSTKHDEPTKSQGSMILTKYLRHV